MMKAAMQKPRAIIFDWDDTLVDTWGVVTAAINATLKHMGHAEWSEAEMRQNVGPPARVLFTQLFGEDRWAEADRVYIKAYEAGIKNLLKTHEQAEEVLQFLKDNGIYLAVVSAKRGTILRQEAAHLGFDKYFSALVGAGDAAKDKPDAEAVRHALKGSGIEPGPDVWFIGDSMTDIRAARNAGCTAILIESKLPAADLRAKEPPDHRTANHEAFIAILKALLAPQISPPFKNPKP